MTANEIGALWTQYIQNSMSVQILSYFLHIVEDEDIKLVVQYALDIAKKVMEDTSLLFKTEKLPHPNGFSEADVDLTAPRLYSDTFMLAFIENLGKAGIVAHGASLAVSTRKDLREFFDESTKATMQLFNMAVDTALSKGIYIRPPHIDVQDDVEYVESKKYLSAFQKRILNMIEVTHLFENIKTNTIGEMVCKSFAQTTRSKDIQNYMERGRQISHKHIKIFAKTLEDSDIIPPMGSEYYVTNSTIPVFSDRLITFLMSVLSATGQGNYSTASTASLRYDIALNYQRLSIEIALYAQDGAHIMIQNGWLEEPPQAPNRKEILNKTNM